MTESNKTITWIVPNLSKGSVSWVCRYAAEGLTRRGWSCRVVAVHDEAFDSIDPKSGVRLASLGLNGETAPRGVLEFLKETRPRYVITGHTPAIIPAYPYFPKECLHALQVHDGMWRYTQVAVRNSQWLDGVICVANHLERSLAPRLAQAGFRGQLGTVHNGAAYPPAPARAESKDELRLLFPSFPDSLKGVLDLPRILQNARRDGVPVHLTIAGGRHALLEKRLKAANLESMVTMLGRVPHEECFRLAANADAALILTRMEAFGMVTVESMAMGCIPLAYDIRSGSREIVSHGHDGFLLPLGDFSALSKTMATLQRDPALRARLSANAMQTARSRFSETAMAERLEVFLTGLEDRASKNELSMRKPGVPEVAAAPPRKSAYLAVPASLRLWIRNVVGDHPRLCYWASRRWRF